MGRIVGKMKQTFGTQDTCWPGRDLRHQPRTVKGPVGTECRRFEISMTFRAIGQGYPVPILAQQYFRRQLPEDGFDDGGLGGGSTQPLL